MSATVFRILSWANASPEEIKNIIDGPARVSPHTYDGQRLFDALDARPDPWVPAVEDQPNDDSVLVWSNDDQPFPVIRRTDDGKEETLQLYVLWVEGETEPRGVCIIEA